MQLNKIFLSFIIKSSQKISFLLRQEIYLTIFLWSKINIRNVIVLFLKSEQLKQV